jgi:sulfur carrier protein
VEIIINGERRPISDESSLSSAVSLITKASAGVAAALNGEVVSRGAWEATPLTAGDEVEVVTAVQGG